jgi:hypothetical protein
MTGSIPIRYRERHGYSRKIRCELGRAGRSYPTPQTTARKDSSRRVRSLEDTCEPPRGILADQQGTATNHSNVARGHWGRIAHLQVISLVLQHPRSTQTCSPVTQHSRNVTVHCWPLGKPLCTRQRHRLAQETTSSHSAPPYFRIPHRSSEAATIKVHKGIRDVRDGTSTRGESDRTAEQSPVSKEVQERHFGPKVPPWCSLRQGHILVRPCGGIPIQRIG